MKFGNILLIVITSIFAFIGLLCTKLYEKYIKQNIVVQAALYFVWTVLVLRVVYWITKPFLHGIFIWCKSLFKNVHVTLSIEPSISLTVVMMIFLLIIVHVIRCQIDRLAK